jgi:hypothetical protein
VPAVRVAAIATAAVASAVTATATGHARRRTFRRLMIVLQSVIVRDACLCQGAAFRVRP